MNKCVTNVTDLNEDAIDARVAPTGSMAISRLDLSREYRGVIDLEIKAVVTKEPGQTDFRLLQVILPRSGASPTSTSPLLW